MTWEYRPFEKPEALDEFIDYAIREKERVDIRIIGYCQSRESDDIDYYESVAHAGEKELLILQMRPPLLTIGGLHDTHTSNLVLEASVIYAHRMHGSGLEVTIRGRPWRSVGCENQYLTSLFGINNLLHQHETETSVDE